MNWRTGLPARTAATLLEHGGLRRGYLGIAGQPVALAEAQRAAGGRDAGLLVVGFACNLLMRPVHARHHLREAAGAV